MKTIALGSHPTMQPIMFNLSVMNYKRKNTKREQNRKFYNYYYGFKKSFKLDYVASEKFKKSKHILYLEKLN